MSMKKSTCLILLTCLSAFYINAQDQPVKKLDGSGISTTDIDKLINQLMKDADVTGLNLGIINNNKVAYVKSYGWKDKAKGELIDTATIFYAASFAKAVFGYLVMQLVQENKIDLDKPIYQYLDKPIPEYVDYKDLAGDDRWKLITARHCLSHTIGFPNWRFLNPKGNRKLEFFFTPGTRYAYSGEGLALLQLAIEKATGRKLEDMMQEKVFQPIGMTRTSYIWQPAFDANHAIGYDGDGNPLPVRKRNNANAAGSMVTTIADYSRFISAIMQGKGLTPSMKKEMIHSQIRINSKAQFPSLRTDTTSDNNKIQLSYGLGWGVLMSPYGKAFFKEGHDDGWEHFNINFTDKGTAIIIMTNSSNGESIFKEALEKIIGDTFTPWRWENYTPYRLAMKVDSTVLREYTGIYEEGKMKFSVALENGILKLRVPEAGLPNAGLYMESKDRFFIRGVDITARFIRNNAGDIEKIMVNDGSDDMEFKRVN
jgi:CubicO group peptidase (beta-lactamase class C family)